MKETKKRYNKQCKMKTITFYKHDADLLAFANSINFQAFVKKALKLCKGDKAFMEIIERTQN